MDGTRAEVKEQGAIQFRPLRDLPYWTLMGLLAAGRFVICWVLLVFSLCALWVIADQIRDSGLNFDRGKAYLAIMAITCGLAWWKTLRHRPSHREWGIAAGLAILLSVVFWILIHKNLADLFREYWPIALAGAVSLAVYIPVHRLRVAVDVCSYRAKSPEQKRKGALVNLLAGCRFVAGCCFCIFSLGWAVVALTELRGSGPVAERPTLWSTAFGAFAVLFGAAWWATLRNRRSQRMWAIAASLFELSAGVGLDRNTPNFVPTLVIFMIGAVSLVAYLFPHRLRYVVDVFSYRLKRPDQNLKEMHLSF